MAAITSINEQSTGTLTVSCLNKSGQSSTPIALTWEAVDLTSGTVLQTATAVTVTGATIEIEIPAMVNRIINPARQYETRLVTVRAQYGENDFCNEVFAYTVKNLKAVS